jgi:hypothetical protein
MICDGRGCSVIAHLHCYFTAGSQDANDAITDIEHWHCENCGGLPRHIHPRPPAAKRARVSFDPDLPGPVVTETPITREALRQANKVGAGADIGPHLDQVLGLGLACAIPPARTRKKKCRGAHHFRALM